MGITARSRCTACLAAAVSLLLCSAACAALPIEIEVAIAPGGSLTAPQAWSKLLGKMDLANVRLRGIRPGDQPEITSRKLETPRNLETQVLWKLLAILNRRDELVVPSGKFKQSDQARLRAYLQKLPQQAGQGELGRFQLTEKQFRLVHANLSQTVEFSTVNLSTREFLRRLEKKITLPLTWAPGAQAAARNPQPLKSELRDMTLGTATAIALRPHGLVLRPENRAGKLSLLISKPHPQQESWPVGWKFDASPRQIAPALYVSLPIEISGFTLAKALEALQPNMKVAVIYDRWILDRDDIHPETIQVKLARKKMYLKRAVDRILSQARLAGELRIDEAGRPFLWITRFGRDSPRAQK